ncbi:MAG: PEP-CTERM sorting domain-containing protein [Schlesneria sp.]
MKRRSVKLFLYLGLLAAYGLSSATHAGNLVQNGDFSNNQFGGLSHELASGNWNTSPTPLVGSGVTGWTNTTNNALNFWFNTTNPTSVGAISQYSEIQLLPPSYNNTNLPDTVTGFLALDGDPNYHGAITQSIGNSTTGFLTVGQQYEVDFYWAATQLTNRTGNTWERLDVQLGNSAVQSVSYGSASDLKLPTHGFTGWTYESMIFTATRATETLSFLSQGGPGNAPPINLLADVSMHAVPEPSSLALSALGIVGLFVVRARRPAKLNA